MKKHLICLCLVACISLSPLAAKAESLDEKSTETAPGAAKNQGEFTHGAGQGKLLMRILLFGAVPQQGVHYMPEGTDLLFALIYSFLKTDSTKMDGITIRRRNSKPLLEVNLESLIEHGRDIPKLYDGDIVTVPYNWRRDLETISLITGFITSMTGFTLAIIALSR
jgi:hypothetical protein